MNSKFIGCWLIVVVAAIHQPVDPFDYINAMKGKTLVMIGDSITRYQYLHLVYLLEYFVWPPEVMGEGKFNVPGSICNEKEAGWRGSFNIFFKESNAGLQGHEVCDCYRTPGWVIENHEYYNLSLNTTVVFLWWAAWPMHYRKDSTKMRPLPKLCHLGNVNDTSSRSTGSEDSSPLPFCDKDGISSHFYHFQRVGRVLQQVVSDYRPQAVVMNSGKHRTYRWDDPEGRPQYESIVEAHEAIRAAGHDTKLVWKSTTPSVNHLKLNISGDANSSMKRGVLHVETNQADLLSAKLVNSKMFELFDANDIIMRLWDREHSLLLTGNQRGHGTTRSSHLPNRFFWDDNHFHCWVHEALNKAMIRQLFMS
jgi:hypothetical protein